MKIVVVLAVQWGYPGDRPERWFHINPYNHSGRRLIGLVGHRNFKVTNACSDIVFRASDKGTPDAAWLRRNLAVLRPDLVLLCGNVAQSTFKRSMVEPETKVMRLPHPAARHWSKKMMKRWTRKIQRHSLQFAL